LAAVSVVKLYIYIYNKGQDRIRNPNDFKLNRTKSSPPTVDP